MSGQATVVADAPELPSLQTRVEWFEEWEERTVEAQKSARRDRNYYDNIQWTREEIRDLEARKQPVITKNRIARKVNFILGEEIRKRVDPVARPRTPQHEDGARAATDALRYVEEEQQFDRVRSAVLKNLLIEGYGGAIKELEEEEGEYKHVLRHVEWDRLFYDPHSRAPDFSDAKYRGIVAWLDLDDALAQYPEAGDAIRAAIDTDQGHTSASTDTTADSPRKGQWSDKRRQRVKVVELYFRVGADWYRADFTKGADLAEPAQTFLKDEKGRHSVCPLEMMSCYVDAEGQRYGVVRQLISPQDEINKRSSKALHLLNVRQVIAEDGYIDDPTKFQTELAKPDGFAEVGPGGLAEGRVQVNTTGDLAQGQFNLLAEAKADIDTIGPSSSTLPDIPESASGRAFLARQQAASQELGPLFDQLRQWTRAVYILDWLSIRWFWTEEKWLRVSDDQELNGYRFVALNRQMTRAERLQELLEHEPAPPIEKALQTAAGNVTPIVLAGAQAQLQALAQQAQAAGQQIPPEQQQQALLQVVLSHPLMAEPITLNQVEQMLVDIVIDEAPETAILAQEEFQTLAEMMPTIVQSRPDMAPILTKLIVKASQLRDKQELLREMDKGPDPQQAQLQQAMQQLQMQKEQGGIAKTQADTQLSQARAAQVSAQTQTEIPRAQTEIALKQAQAMGAGAAAGEKAAGMGGM